MARRLGVALVVVIAMAIGTLLLIRLAGAGATEFRVEGTVLHLSGPITGAAADRLQRTLEQTPGLEVVSLGDIPGADSVIWVTGMGRLIRAAGLETRVSGTVANDGIFLFLGGATRRLAGGTLVLQSDTVQQQMGVALDDSAAAAADRLRYVEAMLGDGAFAAFMAETRATRDNYVLGESDLARFGLTTN